MLNKLSRKDIELLNILAQTPEGKSALDEYIEQHEKAVKAYKIYHESVVAEVEVPNVVKSANELRAEVIQRAKDFVNKNSNENHVKKEGTIRFVGVVTDVLNFIVNDKKRTVVALIKGINTGALYARGIAKCNPDDVFNEHIGKAIALGRALGKDVSEFENAVQPNVIEKAIGQVVSDGTQELVVSPPGVYMYGQGRAAIGSPFVEMAIIIIDDTNAQYGGVE